MLFGDLSWSMNQKAGGEKSRAEMVIFMTAEARAALHSLGFLRFSCTVVLKLVSHFDTSLSSQAV